MDGSRFLFLRPCDDACGRGLSIGIRGKYDMGNEVKFCPQYGMNILSRVTTCILVSGML